MKVWLNGALLEAEDARIDPADRGFTLGDGLFETIAVRGGKILRLEAHLARLRRGCDVLGIPRPAGIENALAELTAADGLKEAALRLTVTRGPAARGLVSPGKIQPTTCITAAVLPGPRPPARCVIATVTRRNEHSPLASIKSLNYLDNILAAREAAAAGAEEAILLNTAGLVAEAAASNLFILKNGQLLTPPVSDGALPGVMRAAVIAATGGREQSLRPEDLPEAEGLLLTSSLGIRLVASIDGKALPDISAYMEKLRSLAA